MEPCRPTTGETFHSLMPCTRLLGITVVRYEAAEVCARLAWDAGPCTSGEVLRGGVTQYQARPQRLSSGWQALTASVPRSGRPSTVANDASMPGRLQFAPYGRVSIADLQDPVASRDWQKVMAKDIRQ
jgi:hypothetical protein